MRGVVAGAIAVAALAACQRDRGAPVPPRAVVYDGATSIGRQILPQAAAAFRARTGVPVDVRGSGTGKGLAAALAGDADVAGVARSLTTEELARRPYFQIVGYDALGVWVNAANPVASLTRKQLEALFTGKAASWRDVGGKAVPVVACTEFRTSRRATVEAFQAMALEGAGYAAAVKELDDPADCLRLVAREPGGVAPATMAYALPGVRAVPIDGVEPTPANVRASTYLLTRPLLLVAREPPSGAVRDFFDFMLSPEGQAIVARAGFVPAR
jgi:phosphate transport system substrate-binding protein